MSCYDVSNAFSTGAITLPPREQKLEGKKKSYFFIYKAQIYSIFVIRISQRVASRKQKSKTGSLGEH